MDDGTIDEFFRTSYPALVARLGVSFGGRVPAEDVVQEALVRAWQRGSDDPIASLPGWVTVVATNLGRDHLRREGALERAYRRSSVERPTDTVQAALGDALAQAVAGLPPRQQEVVVLHYRDDLSVDTIADELGISSGTVKSTLARARQALADRFRPAPEPVVKAWFLSGSHAGDYEHGVEAGERLDGHRVAFVVSRAAGEARGFGTLMQMISAEQVRGCRVRFSGLVRSCEVAGWAGLWMRVDGPGGGPNSLAFDNMQHRAVKGTTPWARYEVVLDVADHAVAVGLGIILAGAGRLGLANFAFEKVGDDVATTSRRPPAYPPFPENLDFSEDG
ncbi:MAG: RNA polymerase sigma factor [Acidimicrobiales bacterium]